MTIMRWFHMPPISPPSIAASAFTSTLMAKHSLSSTLPKTPRPTRLISASPSITLPASCKCDLAADGLSFVTFPHGASSLLDRQALRDKPTSRRLSRFCSLPSRTKHIPRIPGRRASSVRSVEPRQIGRQGPQAGNRIDDGGPVSRAPGNPTQLLLQDGLPAKSALAARAHALSSRRVQAHFDHRPGGQSREPTPRSTRSWSRASTQKAQCPGPCKKPTAGWPVL